MEQLTRLANVIAETYLRYLKDSTNSHQVEHQGVTGEIILDNLSDGLLMNAYSAAKHTGKADVEALAYRYLLPLIHFQGEKYQMTREGLELIALMNRKALSKFKANHPTKIH